MSLELRSEYWTDPNARAAFKEFVNGIFGLDFTAWESAGYWDDRYTPFSYFDGDRVVASVCIYLLDAVLNGRETKLVQISAVGTDVDRRREGLSRELTEIGLEWAHGKHSGVFLFATDGAIPYYERCGFSHCPEYLDVVDAPEAACTGQSVRLDMGSVADRERVYARLCTRTPPSNRFSIMSPQLFMFHALHALRDAIHEIPDLDCIVAFHRESGVLKIYDVVADVMPSFADLYLHLASPDDRTVEFHFGTDRLGLAESRSLRLEGNNPYVLGRFPVPRPVFPFVGRA